MVKHAKELRMPATLHGQPTYRALLDARCHPRRYAVIMREIEEMQETLQRSAARSRQSVRGYSPSADCV